MGTISHDDVIDIGTPLRTIYVEPLVDPVPPKPPPGARLVDHGWKAIIAERPIYEHIARKLYGYPPGVALVYGPPPLPPSPEQFGLLAATLERVLKRRMGDVLVGWRP